MAQGFAIYRISSYKSLPRIIVGHVYTPGGSWSLKLINAGPRIHAGSNWLEACHVVHVGYLISQSAPCQLAMSRCKSYCVSFKLKAVESAEKKSKEAAAREFCVDPKRVREYRTLIFYKRRPHLNAGLVLMPGQHSWEGNKRPGLYSRKYGI